MMSRVCRTGLSCLAVMAFPAPSVAQSTGEHPEVSFARHIRPILQTHCVKCHARGSARGDFSLDTRDAMLAHESAIRPGDAAQSRIIELVRGDDPFLTMPPEGEPLSDEEVAMLRLWIDQGAKWDTDRLFSRTGARPLALREPDVPAARDGLTHPIDRAIRGPSTVLNPEVDDRAFIRRVTLDVIGLLPDPDDVHTFVADRDPDKRAALVAHLLLQQDRYAEHWLTFWNDLLRNDYTGTGYIDGGRRQITAWLYASLRDNMAYDGFVRELVNPRSQESSGFANGITWRGERSASQRTELQYAQTVSQVFLGVNIKCASCHDSFVDGWLLADAYGLAAIVAEEPLELYRCDVPTGEFAEARFIFPEIGRIDPDADKADRMAQFAQLVTATSNGRFARTVVNRVWSRLMGRGLVEPVDEMANEAWSEELLDLLATQFVASGYDLRDLIRFITTSRAYQRVSSEEVGGVFDEFRFHGPTPQRMTAEQFVDAVWMITQTAPAEADAVVGNGARVRASLMKADRLMRILGRSPRDHTVTSRPDTMTTLQALELTNGDILHGWLVRGGASLAARAESADALIETLFLTALSREPSAEERQIARELIGEEVTPDGAADLLWAILMLPEFQLVR